MAGADITRVRARDDRGDRPRAARPGGLHAASPSCRSRPSPRSTATRSAAASSLRSPATSASAAQAEGALIGLPEVRLGLLPGAGGTQRLTALVGPGRATELIMKGLQLSPEQAHADGIVHFLVEPDELDEPKARDYAVRLARQAPIALRGIKRAIRAAQSPDGLAVEGEAFREVLASADAQAGRHGVPGGREGRPFRDLKSTASARGYTLRLASRGGSHPVSVLPAPAAAGPRAPHQAAVARCRRRAPGRGASSVAIVYAGSPATLANGIQHRRRRRRRHVRRAEATKTLEQRARRQRSRSPSTFVAAGARVPAPASQLGLTPDWAAAVAAARQKGDGFGPLRGFRRMKLRLFGGDVAASATYDPTALNAELARIGEGRRPAAPRGRRRPARAACRRSSRRSAGRVLDRDAAGAAIVAALASLSRGAPVALPMQGRRAAR